MKRWIAIAAAAIAVYAAIYYFSRSEPVAVSVVEAGRGRVEATVANTRAGTVKACQRSRLSMPVGGRVAELNVKEGDAVEKGEILLTLWNEDRRAALDQAGASLEVAKRRERQVCLDADHALREAQRFARLYLKGLASDEQVDSYNTQAESRRLACQTAAAEVSAADANVGLLKAQYDLTVLRAPFSGVVAEINGELGEYVTPSPPGVPTPPAIDLIDNTCLYVTAPIDEVDASQLSLGLQARVTLDAFRGRELTGAVSRIAPYVMDYEKQARTVDVDVELQDVPDQIRLLVGYSADIEIVLSAREDVVRLPTEVIVEGAYVWVVGADNLAERREVKTGLGNWSWTEVTDGIAPGDLVIRSLDATGLEADVEVRVSSQSP